jgi:hypothetical protein
MSQTLRDDQDTEGPSMDTGCLVYGVVDPDTVLPDGLRGVDDEPVHVVRNGVVAAVVGPYRLDRPAGRRAELVAFGSVLDALVAAGPVVPVRFGSVMHDEQQVLTDLLETDGHYFRELLDEVRGRVQLNLRATYLEDVVLEEVVRSDPRVAELRAATRELPEEAAYGARVELGELVARHLEVKRELDAESVLDVATRHSTAHAVRGGSGLTHVVDVALLVEEDRRADLEQDLEDLAEVVHERMRLRLVGPLAPYDFVGAE